MTVFSYTFRDQAMGVHSTIGMPALHRETAYAPAPFGAKLLLTHWNWKSAVLSAALRVPIFAIATARRGPAVLGATVVVETAVSIFNAGFYGSIVQLIRNRKPLWLTGVLIVVLIPAFGQAIEAGAHALNHTPHRRVAIFISCILSALSALFNWYAMQHKALLVAEERTPFGRDLKRLPRLIGKFLLLGPQWILGLSSRSKSEDTR